MQLITHWIDGRPYEGVGTRAGPVYDPALGVQRAEVRLGEAVDVAAAVEAAERAAVSWASTSLSRRARILFAFRELLNARAEELAGIITDQHGKVLSDARGEVQRGLEVVEYACGIPQLLKGEYSDQVSTSVDSFSFRQPLGVVAGITPFNFPAMVPLWMMPVAIATGNTFLLKPSERDPSASIFMAELWTEAGLPDGVLNVIQGDRVAVDAILDHPGIAAVSFVGSTPIARYIHHRATANGKRVQALGGAKNHAIVLPDADPGHAAGHLAAAAFGSAGERCMAISAAVIVGDGADRLLDELDTEARRVRVGPGRDGRSEMGPIVTPQARDRIVSLIDAGESQGGVVRVDGRGLTVDGFESGFFVGPTVIDRVTAESEVYTNEVFGPVLSVLRASTIEEAIATVNTSPYGNGTAIFTSDGGAARRFTRQVDVGMIGINVPVPVPMAYHSFGGWKDSLFGEHHIHGADGVRFYTRGKVVTARWPDTHDDASLDMPTAS
jgi:malonate-semialdehyde dehydrogenase (acetylating)/methylmalonate-semialdehyde dehydrogenase